jgi:hypothetical protein
MTGRTAHPHDAAVLVLESRTAAQAPTRGGGRRQGGRARRPDLPADLGVALANLQSAGLAPEIVDVTDADHVDEDAARAS